MNSIKNILLVSLVLFLFSCGDNSVRYTPSAFSTKPEIATEDLSVSFDDGLLRITSSMDEQSQRTYKIDYYIGNANGSLENTCFGMAEFDILDQTIEALYYANIDNLDVDSIIVGVSVDGSPSITKVIFPSPSILDDNKTTISGKCMPISNCSLSKEALATRIKKWMYRNEKPYSEQIVDNICNTIKSFQSNESIWHPISGEEIPVVKNLQGIVYNITTDMKADYYYLFATRDETELDEFIEEVITTNYPQSSKSTKNLPAFRKNEAGGLLGMFLIGLNSDWSKTILPVGLIVVDNDAPKCKTDNDVDRFSFRIRILSTDNHVTIPKYNISIKADEANVPVIRGDFTLMTHQFHGDEAQFEVEFKGDVESFSIKRELHREYRRYSLRPETKTIKLTDVESPYHFTYTLDLGLGDNFIPITVRDFRGNETKFDYKITMVKSEDTPQINVDNEINIW